MRFYGSAMPFPHIQGAFQEYLVAEADQCVVADRLKAGEAAMSEPLAVALHAVKQAGILIGARVLVTGSGSIGALTIFVTRRAGAADLIASRCAIDTAWLGRLYESTNTGVDHQRNLFGRLF